MEISTKECGSKTGDMDKERIGGMKVENWGENTLETGLKTRNMEEERSFIRTETDMMGIGTVECHKEKEEWYIQMRTSMKANGTKVSVMVTVWWPSVMEIILKVTG
jgi:hypothetical protein